MDTLASKVRHEVEIKHSRFIAQAMPVTSPEQALAFFKEVSDADATHNCWAWRLDGEYRFNDDGEPAGTAGRPILSAIDGQGLDRIAVVVTRWYGGIKLGAGGLVRAYGGTAAECLRTAPRQPLIAMSDLEILFGFEDTGAVHSTLMQFAAEKTSEHFDAAGSTVNVRLPLSEVDRIKVALRNATRDRAQVRVDSNAL
ncbi:IMPACT family protein [Lysobacter soyae]|uniref:IMPACT family protein n=1 Tax=Lysobacter soyae TaxID=2764185 RepID=A0ABX8WSW6_9GAMM|nr:YigZ family protein [Lysobacter sp. CJ11]QYR53920.1 IMPACT family protein [Lysobacter sp. CJ11]